MLKTEIDKPVDYLKSEENAAATVTLLKNEQEQEECLTIRVRVIEE